MNNKTPRPNNIRSLIIALTLLGVVLADTLIAYVHAVVTGDAYLGIQLVIIAGGVMGLFSAGTAGVIGFFVSNAEKGSPRFKFTIFAYILPGLIFVALFLAWLMM